MNETANLNNLQNWKSDFKNSLKSSAEIESFFNVSFNLKINYSKFIPLSFAKKIKQAGPNSPLWKQFIPTDLETKDSGLLDPIGDKLQSKGNGIIHRYKSRILFTPTTVCPIICRYCFRKNELSNHDDIFKQSINALEEYLIKHPEVNEVILTGGDPLILSTEKLDQIFKILSNLNIKFVRIHTRTPIILPKRIDQGLINLFNKYELEFTKIVFVLHVNHISELDDEVQKALNQLRQTKIDKKTQTVLLKDINNSTSDLVKLFYGLLDCDFNPYYLHHPDNVKGAQHFRLSLEEGRKIYLNLRQELPGWAIPNYVIDHHLGAGKQFAFNPENIEFSGKLLKSETELINYRT